MEISLHVSQIAAWLDFVAECFAERGDIRHVFERKWTSDPSASPNDILCEFDSQLPSQLNSTLRVYQREIQVGRHVAYCGGVGDVSTRASCRGQGLARRLLDRACAHIAQQTTGRSLRVAALHASRPPVQDFYERCGWRRVLVRYSCIALPVPHSTKLPCDTQIVHLSTLPVDDQGAVLAQIQQLHCNGIRGFVGPLQRTDAYWRQWVLEHGPHRIVVALRKHQVCAYVAGDSSTNAISECFPRHTPLFSHLVNALLSPTTAPCTCPHQLTPEHLPVLSHTTDRGFLYRSVVPSDALLLEQTLFCASIDDHLFLRADSF